jgi:hypothetical protein
VFLDCREVLKHVTGGRTFQRVSDLRGGDRWGNIEIEMHVSLLNIERASRPSVGFTDTADFLFDKGSKPTNQVLFAVFGTPDKVLGELICDVFGVLCIHTRQ